MGAPPAELPVGTLTMLFTDIEGSTALLHRLAADWGDALSQHRAIVRAAVAESGGIEMDTEGDSFFVVFRSAVDAVHATVTAQRNLQAHSWPGGTDLRVRMGVHTGEPQRHEDGYIGADVHRAARIGATAHGGQIVVSASTRALVVETDGITFRDLGEHRLKDLPGSQRLFDVAVPGLITDFPPVRSLGRSATLPVPPTPLVGRDELLDVVAAAAVQPQTRLVTLTGPGGAGKTRVALATAERLASATPGGVWFVSLAAARSAEQAWTRIGDALDLGAAGTDDVAQRVQRHLADRTALLVLDNLEQIPDIDHVVGAVLSAAPQARILATSRRPILLAGETEIPVAPLALPVSVQLDAVAASPAVQMFVQQAKMIRPSFTLDGSNSADVARLCGHLDGLPLALELAAANLRVLSPRALLSRLDNRLGTGTTAADRPNRQRTLGATIAWSYDLLSEADRTVFRRLGVFRGLADVDAVAAVAAADVGGQDVDPLEVVVRLVDASLVQVAAGVDGEPRVSLLETIRMFALDRLDGSDEGDAIRLRHLRWCADVVGRATAMLRGPRHTQALDQLGAIEDDIRAALEYAIRPGADDPSATERTDLGQRLLIDVTTRYWYRFGSVTEARHWQERGLAVIDSDDSPGKVWLLHGFGISLIQQGEAAAAERTFTQSLQMARRIGDRKLESRALNDLAIACRQSGRGAEALALLHEALAVANEAGARDYESISLGNLVVVHIDLGDYVEAARAALRSMEVNTALGEDWGLAVDRLNYTAAVLKSDGAVAAHDRYVAWAPTVLEFRDNELSIDLIELGASIASALGQHELAARLLGAADACRAAVRMWRPVPEETLLQEWLAASRAALAVAQWQTAYAAGAGMTPAEAVERVCAIAVGASTG